MKATIHRDTDKDTHIQTHILTKKRRFLLFELKQYISYISYSIYFSICVCACFSLLNLERCVCIDLNAVSVVDVKTFEMSPEKYCLSDTCNSLKILERVN